MVEVGGAEDKVMEMEEVKVAGVEATGMIREGSMIRMKTERGSERGRRSGG